MSDRLHRLCGGLSLTCISRKGEYAGDLHARLAEAGYIGICMPTEMGGAGLGIAEATVMLQTVSESGAGIAGAQTS